MSETYEILGRTVTMPVEVRSALMASATFNVDADAAQSVIDGTGLTVQRRRRNRTTVSLALVRYIDCDLGDYNELGLAFAVDDPPGSPKPPRMSMATYIHRLPVNQEFTCAAGRGIWGFPKWVADLDVDIAPTGARAVLRSDDGHELVRVELDPARIPVPSWPLKMRCYSNDDAGNILRTAWHTNNKGIQVRPKGGRVVIGDGHVFCDELRSMGLADAEPIMCMYASRMRATFAAPEIVGSVPQPDPAPGASPTPASAATDAAQR